MIEKRVAAGLSSPAHSVGLTGLVPFAVQTLPEVVLAPKPGVIRILIGLPAGRRLLADRPLTYRVHAGEAGLEFVRHGQIVNVHGATLPLVVPYALREHPAPPARSDIAVDFAFWYTDGGPARAQDVQWRMPIRFGANGTDRIELHFTLPE